MEIEPKVLGFLHSAHGNEITKEEHVNETHMLCFTLHKTEHVSKTFSFSYINIYKYFFIFISRHARKKFELLEKHKDYVERAQAFHKKEDTLRVSVLASCLVGNQTLKYIMGLFCKWVFFFLLYRNFRKKQLLETQMNFTSKWSKQEPLMESKTEHVCSFTCPVPW